MRHMGKRGVCLVVVHVDEESGGEHDEERLGLELRLRHLAEEEGHVRGDDARVLGVRVAAEPRVPAIFGDFFEFNF